MKLVPSSLAGGILSLPVKSQQLLRNHRMQCLPHQLTLLCVIPMSLQGTGSSVLAPYHPQEDYHIILIFSFVLHTSTQDALA